MNARMKRLWAAAIALALLAPLPASAGKVAKAFFCSTLFMKKGKSFEAELDDPVARGAFAFSTGTRMRIRVSGSKEIEGQFLGRYLAKARETTGYLFYHEADDLVYVVDEDKLRLVHRGRAVAPERLQPIIDPVEQSGNYCMAYGLEYLVHQLDVNGLDGYSALDRFLAKEESRTKLLTDFISEYYDNARRKFNARNIVNDQLETIFSKFREKPNVACRTLHIKSADRFIQAMITAIDAGSPVLLEFFIERDMTVAGTKTIVAGERRVEDPRLWIPRKRQLKSEEGHGLVATQYFTTPEGKLKFLVGDSDWEHVRVWDADEYIRTRYETSGMLGHVCGKI